MKKIKQLDYQDKQNKTAKAQEKLKELQRFVKNENHFHDDHGTVIIGNRDYPPVFSDSE
jgi:hypothetical protein